MFFFFFCVAEILGECYVNAEPIQPYSCILSNWLDIWKVQEEVSRKKVTTGYNNKVRWFLHPPSPSLCGVHWSSKSWYMFSGMRFLTVSIAASRSWRSLCNKYRLKWSYRVLTTMDLTLLLQWCLCCLRKRLLATLKCGYRLSRMYQRLDEGKLDIIIMF